MSVYKKIVCTNRETARIHDEFKQIVYDLMGQFRFRPKDCVHRLSKDALLYLLEFVRCAKFLEKDIIMYYHPKAVFAIEKSSFKQSDVLYNLDNLRASEELNKQNVKTLILFFEYLGYSRDYIIKYIDFRMHTLLLQLANYFDAPDLTYILCSYVANLIKGKNADEMREILKY